MNSFLDAIDKYKFGLLAALGTYVFIFIYLQMASYTEYRTIEPFHDGSYVEIPEDEIELQPDNIMVPSDFSNVKNASRDENDSRERSYDDYATSTSTKSAAEIEEEYKRLEEQMYQDAGGEKTRAEIRAEMESRKQQELDAAKNKEPREVANNGGDNVAAGTVLKSWKVGSGTRNPHLNNDWYIRTPGYRSYKGGVVVVNIKVNSNGDVISAEYNAGRSSGATAEMIQDAIKYAKMSRFEYASEKYQTGWIQYTFVGQ